MRVLVFLGLGADVRVAPQCDPRSGHVREEWLVREVDPASARALDLGLQMKAVRRQTEVTVIHFGPATADPWLRHALARGADRAVRIWDDEVAGARVAGKALILAAAAQASGFDLVLTGAAGVIDAAGQLGVLLAAYLDVPCVTQVVETLASQGPDSPVFTAAGTAPDRGAGARSLEMVRALDQGFRERVEVSLPAVATVSAGESGGLGVAPVDIPVGALLAAECREIPVWDLADLGVPRERVRDVNEVMRCDRPRPPRPRLRRVAAPDPTLPAFDRILSLIQGSVQRREGRVVRQPAEAIVDEIFGTLRDEGWLDHLRSGRSRGESPGPGPGESQ